MSIIGTLTPTFANGDLEDATVVMALFAFIRAQVNANAAVAGPLAASGITGAAGSADVQAQAFTAFTTAGTSTAYTLTPSPALAAYAANQSFVVNVHTAAGANPTLNISGLGATLNLVSRLFDGSLVNINGNLPAGVYRMTLVSTTQVLVEALPAAYVARAYAELSTYTSVTNIIPYDNTIPQNTEGTQILSVAFTPKSVNSRVRLRFRCQFTANLANDTCTAALFSSASANALAATPQLVVASGNTHTLLVEHEYVPGVTTALTFSVRAGPDQASTMFINGTTTSGTFAGVNKATLVVEEIAP